jgi:hypothetical protein
MRTPHWFLGLAFALTLAWVTPLARAQTPTFGILSTYLNAYALNGVLYQNMTLTIQCTDADYGITRYLTITMADGTTSLLGIQCSAPTYLYTTTLVGYVPNNGVFQGYSSCLMQSPFTVDPSTVPQIDFNRSPANPGQIVALSKHKQRLAREDGRHESIHMQRHWDRKSFFDGGNSLANFMSFGLYCTFKDCSGSNGPDLTDLTNKVDQLQGAKDALNASITALANGLTTYITTQANLSAATTASITSLQTLMDQNIDRATTSIMIQQNTTDYLTRLNQGLTTDVSNMQANIVATQTSVATLSANLAANFNITQGNINNVVYNVNLALANLTASTNTGFNRTTKSLAYLRARLDKLIENIQQQIGQINAIQRNTQGRRAESQWFHALLQPTLTAGLTPFLLNLGVPPSGDSNDLVWKLNIEVTRIMYIRNNLGLTAQQVDVGWYCNTQKLLDFGSSVSSFSDLLRRFGPSDCNASIAESCECWATSQRYSCPTTSSAVNASNWLTSTDLRNSTVCNGSAVTTSTLTVHVTLDTLFAMFAAVCSDGTDATDGYGKLRVLSGQTGLQGSVPYNALVCPMVYDTIIDVANTGQNFMYATFFYLQMAFSKVYTSSDYYARYVYGVVPDGVTTRTDDMAVINGTDAKCHYHGFMSYDTGTVPMLPVYKIEFASQQTVVTTTINNVTSSTITDVTVSVPNSLVLPITDTVVIGDPADPSAIFNVPYTDCSISLSPEGRCGHITYPIIDSPSNFTMYKWDAFNNQPFDAFCATNVASYYRRTLNGQGLCTGSALIGEGAWCTTRTSFAISSRVGGFAAQPRVGTSSTVIARAIIPNGNLTQIIFSSCPSYSLVQDAPNVARLTLGNPRIDADITVAIVLGGDCAATTSSFVVPKNNQRDFFVPVCVGTSSSSRTISIFRYDSNDVLQPCGNTTNITVDRATFISTFNTPDLIQTAITTQTVMDSNQLALMQSNIDLRNQLAQLVLVQAQSTVALGLQIPQASYNASLALLTALNLAAITDAQRLNATRNTQLYNYTSSFNSYAGNVAGLLASQQASINASQATLTTLASQVFDATSLAAQLGNLSVSVNALIFNFSAALVNYANLDVVAQRATISTFSQIHSSPGLFSDLFGGIGGVLTGVIDAGDDVFHGSVDLLKTGIGAVVTAVVAVAQVAYDIVKAGLQALMGMAASLFQGIFYAMMAIVGLMVLIAVYYAFQSPQLRKILKNELSSADLKGGPGGLSSLFGGASGGSASGGGAGGLGGLFGGAATGPQPPAGIPISGMTGGLAGSGLEGPSASQIATMTSNLKMPAGGVPTTPVGWAQAAYENKDAIVTLAKDPAFQAAAKQQIVGNIQGLAAAATATGSRSDGHSRLQAEQIRLMEGSRGPAPAATRKQRQRQLQYAV